jgi:hypothetical protein
MKVNCKIRNRMLQLAELNSEVIPVFQNIPRK